MSKNKFKVVLGEKIPDFPAPITFNAPDGREATIVFTFAHLTQTELDELSGTVAPGDVVASKKQGADQIEAIVKGWDLEDEFTPANLQKLFDFYPSVKRLILEEYANALLGYKIKN